MDTWAGRSTLPVVVSLIYDEMLLSINFQKK